jgi:WD40 repeat protein
MKYQVGGSLNSNDPSYVVRQADEELYTCLRAGDFCYVLNSRQMGKSSLLYRTKERLTAEGYRCVYVDMTRLGSEETTPEQWYKGITIALAYGLNLPQQFNFQQWWKVQSELSFIQKLDRFVEEILLSLEPGCNTVIFIDEIDSLLSLKFPIVDFFDWIRYCYNQRSNDPRFYRLGFAFFGVASSSDLIGDKRRTPFNIGRAIELYGFKLEEAKPLIAGLETVISQPQLVLEQIIYWTGGQPFLTQKLCQIIVQIARKTPEQKIDLTPEIVNDWVEQIVTKYILNHWKSQDEPEHLRTIRDRILYNEQRAGRLLGIYQQVLETEIFPGTPGEHPPIPLDDSREQIELLLSGLVEKYHGHLKIKNPIYRLVFNQEWVLRELDNLRPYSQLFNAWVRSSYQDESRLLRGKALTDAQNWAQGKSLSDLDYRFFAASQASEQRDVQTALEAARVQEVAARLAQEKKTAVFQRYLLVTVGIGLFCSTSLGIGAFLLYRESQISKIRALASAAEGQFASHRRLDALLAAIKAKGELQQFGRSTPEIEHQVNDILEQTVQGVDEYNRFSGHGAAVISLDVSPDSSLIASGSADKTLRLWRQDGRAVAVLQGHQSLIRAVKFSPDGQMLASGSEDRTIKLWKSDGTLLRTFKGHQAAVWGVAFSPDGQFLVSGSWDKTVKVWRLDGTVVKTFRDDQAAFSQVAVSPDGKTIAASTFYGTVRVFRRDNSGWENAQILPPLTGHTAWNFAVAFSPDGRTIASGSQDRTVKLWQLDPQQARYRLVRTLQGQEGGITGVAFSPDGQRIAATSLDKSIQLWQSDGAKLTTLKGHTNGVWGVKFSPNGKFIASAGGDNSIRLWHSENPFCQKILAHNGGIWSLEIAPDSSKIATASLSDNIVKLWDRRGKLLKTYNGVFDLTFSDRDRSIVLLTYNDRVQIETLDGKFIASYPYNHNKITGAIWSPNEQAIAMSNAEGIHLWQLGPPQQRYTIKHDRGEVWNIAFSPDSRMVATAGGDGKIQLRTLEGKLINSFQAHSTVVWRVAFSPDGKMLASGSGDKTVKLWTLEGKLVQTFTGHNAAIWGLSFSNDGKILAAGSVDETVKLWKIDGTELRTLSGHTAGIRKIGISRDGTFLISGGDDNTLIIWNLPRILKLDPLTYGCNLVRDYLHTNLNLEPADRALCDAKK